MTLYVKPISALLTRDTEVFSNMVPPPLFRIPISSLFSEVKSKGVGLINKEEKNLSGMKFSPSNPPPTL